jgi:NADPH-dependent ferric siderophore reductase
MPTRGKIIVTETVPTLPGGDMTTEAFLARSPEVSLLNLRVVEITDTGSATRVIRLGGADLVGFAYAPGQDLMILADTSGGRIIRRRYTIRRSDPASSTLDVQVVTDSDGPGARWATALAVGDAVEAVGPRGKITIAAGVDRHVFLGDDVAAPAIAAMIEALPAGARATAVVEVADATDESKVDPAHAVDVDLAWLHRAGRPAGTPEALVAAARSVALETGAHVYVFAEASVVSAVAAVLRERGVPAERMSTKAYWGRGRANASHGEPLKS